MSEYGGAKLIDQEIQPILELYPLNIKNALCLDPMSGRSKWLLQTDVRLKNNAQGTCKTGTDVIYRWSPLSPSKQWVSNYQYPTNQK